MSSKRSIVVVHQRALWTDPFEKSFGMLGEVGVRINQDDLSLKLVQGAQKSRVFRSMGVFSVKHPPIHLVIIDDEMPNGEIVTPARSRGYQHNLNVVIALPEEMDG
jgi:hypothetical protein